MVSLYEEDTTSMIEDKRNTRRRAYTLVKTSKAHATGMFVVVEYNGGCVLLRLASSLALWSNAGWQIQI